MKVGHFQISFEEVEVPLQGIPIRVTRTYDTRQAHESLDFGHGWTIDYQNVRIRESRKMGFSWTIQQEGGPLGAFCVRPNGSPLVTITLPDGDVQSFRAKWSAECQSWLPGIYGNLLFEPADDNTHGQLDQLNYGLLRVTTVAGGGTNLVDPDSPSTPVDPSLYKLTTEEGMTYLDQNFGVLRIVDELDNWVHYTENGVYHSTGVSVSFVRDSAERISALVLPDGRRINYSYSPAGDLLSATDAIGQASRFAYLPDPRFPHWLDTITDARGVAAIRQEYDDDGRLVATTDAAGNRIEYVHNIAGRTETIRNRRGFATTYVYDDNGYVLSETNALGEQTLYTHDHNGNETSRTDPLGRTTTFELDVRGNVLVETDPMGAITTRTWGSQNQLLTEIDPEGRAVVTNTYRRRPFSSQISSYLETSTDALGQVTHFYFDICAAGCNNTGNLQDLTDALGQHTRFNYDFWGNLNRETDPAGHVTTRSFDAMGRVLTETRTRTVDGQTQELITRYAYDAKGRATQTTHPDGSITRTVFNAIDKVEQEIDALGRITRYEYNARGEQTAVVHADGSREETRFDAEGNVISQTDRAGRVTKMVYDPANRLIETILPDATPEDDNDNPRTVNTYDAAGQLVAVTDARGAVTQYRYDLAGRQIEVIDALGNTMSSDYDDSGRRIAMTDPAGNTTRLVHDAAGRLIETIHPDSTPGDDGDNPRTRHEYDAVGRKTADIDEMGRITRYGYDALSRLTTVVLPNPTNGNNPAFIDGQPPTNAGTLITRYIYDEQGSKLEQIDALGRMTRFEYDTMGRQTARILPLGQRERFSYNAAGERSTQVHFNGHSINASFDALGRIETLTLPEGQRRFEYSASGQIARIDDNGQIYSYTYDERDRLIQAVDPFGRSIDYAYDANGNRIALQTSRQQIAYEFDPLNRLSEVSAIIDGSVPQTTTYHYDVNGNRAGQTHPNGTTVEYRFDPRNRLKTLIHRAGTGATAAVLLSLSYTVDASGLRTQISETRPGTTTAITRSTSYTYDHAKRLTAERVSGNPYQTRTTIWTYDSVGNRLRVTSSGTISRNQTYTYDANDRLTAETGTQPAQYSYDPAGNLLEKRNGATIQASYQWDSEDRLQSATLNPGASQTLTSYAYDPNGIRRASEFNDGTEHTRTEYLVDPNQAYAQVLEEWGTATTPGQPFGALETQALYLHGDDLISQTRLHAGLAQTHVYHYDGLGTTRALSDVSGVVTDRYAHTAFGTADPAGASGNNANSAENPYQYTGEQLDAELGWYYLRARYMDPQAGRFVGMDSWMGNRNSPISLHRFSYASGNPVSFTDPSGQMTLGSLNAGLNGQARLALSAQTLPRAAVQIARKAKIFDIYDYVAWPLHFYMYAERKPTRSGIRYDVGNAVGWGGIFRQNPLGVIPGGFVSASQVRGRSGLTGRGVRIVSLTLGQWLTWHVSVVGTETAACRIDAPYSLTPGLGTNCLSWTIWGTAKAIAASRLPL